MKRSSDKTAKAEPVELGEEELGEVAGGGIKLENVLISSYQTGGASRDGTPDIIVGAGPGGGPHIR